MICRIVFGLSSLAGLVLGAAAGYYNALTGNVIPSAPQLTWLFLAGVAIPALVCPLIRKLEHWLALTAMDMAAVVLLAGGLSFKTPVLGFISIVLFAYSLLGIALDKRKQPVPTES